VCARYHRLLDGKYLGDAEVRAESGKGRKNAGRKD